MVMVSVPRQSSNSSGPTRAVFGGSTVFNCYCATVVNSVFNFMRNLKCSKDICVGRGFVSKLVCNYI